jgi:hypothetical protein
MRNRNLPRTNKRLCTIVHVRVMGSVAPGSVSAPSFRTFHFSATLVFSVLLGRTSAASACNASLSFLTVLAQRRLPRPSNTGPFVQIYIDSSSGGFHPSSP